MTSLIGRRMLRREDRPLLTGQAEFVDDLELEGMLHIRFFRSPIAHGRIEALDLEAARAVPGVVAVLGPDDVPVPPLHPPIENPDAHSPPRPQLAKGVVRFVGEPMAVIVADSPYAAEDAAELIEATLDPLPAVVDPLAAADAAAIHDHPTNILFDTGMEAGDVDGAFAEAAVIVERTFRSPRYSATPMESRGRHRRPRRRRRARVGLDADPAPARRGHLRPAPPRPGARARVDHGRRRRLRAEGARLPGGDPHRLAGAGARPPGQVGRGPQREPARLQPRPRPGRARARGRRRPRAGCWPSTPTSSATTAPTASSRTATSSRRWGRRR